MNKLWHSMYMKSSGDMDRILTNPISWRLDHFLNQTPWLKRKKQSKCLPSRECHSQKWRTSLRTDECNFSFWIKRNAHEIMRCLMMSALWYALVCASVLLSEMQTVQSNIENTGKTNVIRLTYAAVPWYFALWAPFWQILRLHCEVRATLGL